MAEQLLAHWDDWSDGLGTLHHGAGNGLAWARGMIGGKGFLAPTALQKGATSVIDSGYTIRYGFVNKDSNSDPHLYLLADNGTDGRVYKFSLKAGSYLTAGGATSYAGKRLGHPVRYKGNWYYTELGGSLMRKLTVTGVGAIGGDTIVNGDAGSGDGHLISYGHQIAKIQPTDGISILKTGGDANADADWGSDFPCGDSDDDSIGGASLQGLAYVLRGRGLYTFNDRGRAGSIFEDFDAWQQEDIKYWSIAPWKGGLVFSRLDAVYYWYPGILPINISLGGRNLAQDPDRIRDIRRLRYRSISAIGDFIYVSYALTPTSNSGGILVGEAVGGDPTKIAWWNLYDGTISTEPGILLPTEGGAVDNGSATTVVISQASADLIVIPLSASGSPNITTSEYLMSGNTSSYADLPNINLGGKTPTKLRLLVENLGGTVSPAPTTRSSLNILAPKRNAGGGRLVLDTIYQDGVTEVNLKGVILPNDILSLAVSYIAESSALAQLPPTIRWVEVYGED